MARVFRFSLIIIFGLVGCSTTEQAPGPNFVRQETQQGMQSLRSGQYQSAIQSFNRALAFSPQNGKLHFLAGLAYHLAADRSDPSALELAEVGYKVSEELAPSEPLTKIQLGRLYLETRNYPRAQAAFAGAFELERDNTDSAIGLAVASYYSGDIQTALGAIRLAERLKSNDEAILRAGVLIRSAAGDAEEAQAIRRSAHMASLSGDELHFIDRRAEQWTEFLKSPADDTPPPRIQLAMPRVIGSQPTSSSSASNSSDTQPSNSAASSNTPQGNVPVAPSWADCNANLNTGFTSSYDDTKSLTPLPSPCSGHPMPRMLQIDATILRTDDTVNRNTGVNLLNGLQAVFNLTKTLGSHAANVTSLVANVGLPSNGITYSLNIVNSVDQRADIVSKPTLMALDRQPAQFFSGEDLTIAIPGQLSGGSLFDKPLGVSLSVTPTFVSDDTILLAVRVSRRTSEIGQPGTFTQALQTTHNLVESTAILKFNQTLILSGLVEYEHQGSKSGVPFLDSVPGVQYFFSTGSDQNFRRSILVTITPRRVAVADSSRDATAASSSTDPLVAEVRQKLQRDYVAPRSQILSIMSAQEKNRYYDQFRQGDLVEDNWRSGTSLTRLIDKLGGFLLF